MKYISIISTAIGILVSLPTLAGMVYTWVNYGEAIIGIAEACTSGAFDCKDPRWQTVLDDVEELQKERTFP